MRIAVTVFAAIVLVLLQSTVLELAPVHMVTPSCGLLVVLYASFSERWTLSSAALFAFGLGYLFDLVSGAPLGVHAFVYLVMSQLARVLSTRVVMRGVVLSAGISFVAGLLSGLLIVMLRAQVNPEGGYDGLGEIPLEALLTGLFAPPILWILRQLEGRLDPTRLRVGLARRRRRSLSHAATQR